MTHAVSDQRRAYRHPVSEQQMTQPLVHPMRRGRTTTTVALLAAACALTACGGSGSGAASTPTTTPAAQQARGGAFGAAFPGANGQIAALSGRTLQVQSPQSGQVAVTWTTATTFSRTVPAAASAVAVGSCVDVRTDAATSASGSSGGTAYTDVTATSITLSSPVKGSCSTGRGEFGAGGGLGFGGGTGPPSGFPSGAPSGFPSGGQGGRSGNGGGFARPVVGRVTAVHAGVLTVAAVDFAGRAPGGTAAPTTGATETAPVTVHTSATTTWMRTTTGTAKDLAVGQCVSALGKADDTGAVTATTIASRPAQDGQCTIGFGRGGTTSTGSP
jgi:hypothetical protein